MNKPFNPITQGIHHIGLTVSRLEESATFFTTVLVWKEVSRNVDYPAIFVTDDFNMVTLWQNKETPAIPFSKNQNIGLHHIAFKVEFERDLNQIHETLVSNNIRIEFSPELIRQGPAKHLMCYEPSGIRVEFIWPGT